MTATLKKFHSLMLMVALMIGSLALCSCDDNDDDPINDNNRPAYLVGKWECGTHRIELYADGLYKEFSGSKLVKDLTKWYISSDKLIATYAGSGSLSGVSYLYEYNKDTDVMTLAYDKYYRIKE